MTMSHILVVARRDFYWRGQHKGCIHPLGSDTKGQKHQTTGGWMHTSRATKKLEEGFFDDCLFDVT